MRGWDIRRVEDPMDFMKILRSFEELLFEATTWLVFYPATLWRILRHPIQTMDYSDREQTDRDEGRYDDALSPPLLLLITLVLTNVAALALHVSEGEATTTLSHVVLDSEQNRIAFRSLMFSMIPLVAAVTLVRRQGKRISRETLRAPFYAQCYLAAPTAIGMSAGAIIFQRPDASNLIGLLILAAGFGWFLAVQTEWFSRKLDVSRGKAALITAWATLRAIAYILLLIVPVALI